MSRSFQHPSTVLAAVVCLSVPSVARAHPASFDELALTVEDASKRESTKLVLKSNREITLARTLAGRSAEPVANTISERELAGVRAAFAGAHVATLPVVASLAAPGRTFTLATKTGRRTYGYTATVGAEAPRARPLLRALRDVMERFFLPVPGEELEVSGRVMATFGPPLPGHRFALAVDVKGHGLTIANEPFVTIVEKALPPATLTTETVTLAGRVVEAPGLGLKTHGIQVSWVLGTAKRDLEVRVAQFDTAALNSRHRVRAGDRVKIVNLMNGYYWIQFPGAPLDYSFVKADGVALTSGDLPVPHVRGKVEVSRGRVRIATDRGTFAVGFSSAGGALPHYWDDLLEPVQGKLVTLIGSIDRGGEAVDAEAILGTAKESLVVRVFPDEHAALNTFTAAPSGSLPRGTRFKILGRRQNGFIQIRLLAGPASGDGYAFVKLAGVEYAE